MCGPCVHCWQLQQTSGDVVAVEAVVMKRSPNFLALRTPCAGEKKVAGGPGCQPLDDAEALRAWAAAPQKENRYPEQPECLSYCLRGKRTAAAATARRIGILEDESLAHQVFLPLERGVVEIEVTLGVHKQPRAMLLEDFVAVARLRLKAHRIGQARAAAALHTHAKPAGFGGNTVFGEESADFFSGLFCQMDHHSITQTSEQRKARGIPGSAGS